ncbi:hypothetical protein LTR47_005179 [Exophiala xenobiotica]|nr:hypothetical protein LTR47_005179 [Exophiala xenobiotica]KAK5249692.1 hypothetical protein LTS06_005474 [Exophiala xenobiotica]KAK5356864.1 hypothetical protein LTR61_000600 [Exophiala xenobiotica]KAK5377018.1 hypothetical protein LTR11_004683 [Exophiala xenobiotica]KAK5379546.1 hypothetical protein LTS03_004425 [Exophiala xenobiotica]
MSENGESTAARDSPVAAAETQARRAGMKCKACIKCRTKKVVHVAGHIKCDSQRPRCGQCTSSKDTCRYGNDKRSHPRGGNYSFATFAAKLEALEGILQNIDKRSASNGVQSSPVDENEIVRDANPTLTASTIMLPRSAPSPSQQDSPALWQSSDQDLHRGNGDGQEFAQAPEDHSEAARSIQMLVQPPNLTPETLTNFIVDEEGSVSAHGLSSAYRYQEDYPPHHLEASASTTHSAGASLANDSDDTRLRLVAYASLEKQKEAAALLQGSYDFDGVDPATAQHLLDIHWNRHHVMFLLTYRPLVMQKHAPDDTYVNALLWNAIFYASSLHSYRPSVISDVDGNGQRLQDRFQHRFKCLLPDALEKSSAPSAAALLLMGSSLVSSGRRTAGWHYCGLGYRMIIDLGMHLDGGKTQTSQPLSAQKHVKFSPAELEMRKRIFYGAYVLDKVQSLYFGRPPALRLLGTEPSPELLDTFEELELWAPYVDPLLPPPSASQAYRPRPSHIVTTFQALLKLAELANEIIEKFYIPTAGHSIAGAATENLRLVRAKLDNWRMTLPAHLQDNHQNPPFPTPHHITLHTTYQTLIILLHRPFLPEGHLNAIHAGDVPCRQICLAAARTICSLANVYEDAFTLDHAPYLFSYALFSAATIVTRHASDRALMTFLWKSLTKIQRGSNFGLAKPLMIIRDLMDRSGIDFKMVTSAVHHLQQLNSRETPRPSDGNASNAEAVQLESSFDHSIFGTSNGDFDLAWLENFNSWYAPGDDSMQWLETSTAGPGDSMVLYGLFDSSF